MIARTRVVCPVTVAQVATAIEESAGSRAAAVRTRRMVTAARVAMIGNAIDIAMRSVNDIGARRRIASIGIAQKNIRVRSGIGKATTRSGTRTPVETNESIRTNIYTRKVTDDLTRRNEKGECIWCRTLEVVTRSGVFRDYLLLYRNAE